MNDRFFLALRFNPKSELVDAGQAAGCAIVGARLKSTDLNDVEDLGSFTLGVLHGAHEVPFAVDSERLDLVRAGGRLRGSRGGRQSMRGSEPVGGGLDLEQRSVEVTVGQRCVSCNKSRRLLVGCATELGADEIEGSNSERKGLAFVQLA